MFHLGWRYVLGVLCTSVPVTSLAQATDVAARVVAAAGTDADGHVWLQLRPDRVSVQVQTLATATVTPSDVELDGRISTAVREAGLQTGVGAGADGGARPR